jgi:hypothetical protein
MAWIGHLQSAYFGQQSIPKWTLEQDGSDPPRCPNAYKNPLAQITFRVPSAPSDDPHRGPSSPRHKSWSADSRGPSEFDWVPLDSSCQWHAFRRLIELLRQRGNEVLVVLGPFNEHLMSEDSRSSYRKLSEGIARWLLGHQVPCVCPDTLPTAFYADASHPLTPGYEFLAKRIAEDRTFQDWLRR